MKEKTGRRKESVQQPEEKIRAGEENKGRRAADDLRLQMKRRVRRGQRGGKGAARDKGRLLSQRELYDVFWCVVLSSCCV